MTPQELSELDYAKRLPAWTRLKVRDDVVGWRAFTAHEICVLDEIFELITDQMHDDPECLSDYRALAKTLGLLVEDASDE